MALAMRGSNVCEMCNTSYADIMDAKRCEEDHKKCKKIIDAKYFSYKADHTGKLNKICVMLDDGDIEWYKR